MPTERRTRGPRAAHRPPKHGARALARHLAAGTLDRRTWVARAFDDIGDALADDRGGWSNVTAGERILIERCAAEVLFLRAIEAWAFGQPSIIEQNGDGPRLLGPLQKGYTSHLGALTRALSALGVRPDKVDRLPSLEQYLRERAGAAPTAAPASEPEATQPEPLPTSADPTDATP